LPELSARSCPLASAVPISQPWMSFAVSPSPSPSSGSLLVAAERSAAPAEPETPPSTVTVVVTSTSLWFGGQSEGGEDEQTSAGGVASIFTVADAVESGAAPALPTPSVARQLTSCTPSPVTVSGALALRGAEAGHRADRRAGAADRRHLAEVVGGH
jgi:hypothetical protein